MAPAPVTFGIWIRASTRSFPPAAAWKSLRPVSIRPDVHWPEPSRTGVIRRFPDPSSATLLVLFVMVSTSPVPKLAGPPGYEVPTSYCQLPPTWLPAAPLKSSLKTRFQPDGGGGTEARATDTVSAEVASRAAATRGMGQARRRRRATAGTVVDECIGPASRSARWGRSSMVMGGRRERLHNS